MNAVSDASSIHSNNSYCSAALSSMSLPQPITRPPLDEQKEGEGGPVDPNHRLSLQFQESYATSVSQLQKMYTCVVRFASTDLYHPAAGITPQQYRFSTPRGIEFEDANQAREVAAKVALQHLKRVAGANTSRKQWASVARRSAVTYAV